MSRLKKPNTILLLFGTALLVLIINISNLSPFLSDKENLDSSKILLLVFLLTLAGLIYLYNVKKLNLIDKSSLVLIILFGILFRVVFIFSEPILEDDYYRYLWDGAVLANGESPYEHSPEEIVNGGGSNKLGALAEDSGDIIKKINNPSFKTIYPTVAQMFFSLSYLISPWNVVVWKIILLGFDLITLALLMLTFQRLKIPLTNILIYWWNPLLIKEIFNSGHMDVMVFPLVLAALLLFLKNKKYISTGLLSLSVGIKLWPVFFLPLFLNPLTKKPKELVLKITVFAVTAAVIFVPVLLSQFDSASGFVAYSKSWENNSSFFRIVLFALESVLSAVDIHPGHAQKYARILIVAILLLWIVYVAFVNSSESIYKKAFLIVGFAFLISPTQFPWYFTWVILFLSITPHLSFLSLTALLPFYYFRYFLEPLGDLNFFTNVIVWLEFVPVWFLIFWAWKKGKFSISS